MRQARDSDFGDFLGEGFGAFRYVKRAYASSIASGDGCTYRWETVTVECPISFIIVNASAPDSPSRAPNVAATNVARSRSAF
jgi:hypothetical protein